MRFGARVFKTGVTLVLTLMITDFFGLGPGVIAAIAAIFTLQPSVHRSIIDFWNQLRANSLGAVTAIVMVLLFGNNYVVIGLTAIIILALLQLLKLQSVYSVAVITIVAVMDAPNIVETSSTTDFLEAAMMRFSLVMIGVTCSLLVNLIFLPPKYETKLYHNTVNLANDIFTWLRLELNTVSEYPAVKKDIESLEERKVSLDTMYLWYKEEQNYLKKDQFPALRRKILFKTMIDSTKRALDVLKKLNRHQNDFYHLDDDLKYRIKFEMEELMSNHEQIFMKVTEKISPEVESQTYVDQHFEDSMMDLFLKLYNSKESPDEKKSYENVLEIISSIHEYSVALSRLDRISSSFFRYHSEKNNINIHEETLDI